MTRAFVVGRRRKGRDPGPVVAAAMRTLAAAGWSVESAVVTSKRDLKRLTRNAVRRGCDVVVAVGGDGLVRRVASRVAGSSAALAIIPSGTGNLLAGNLGIPRDPDKATRVILTGQRRTIDLGRATVDGKRHDFSVACGIGFDARVMDKTGTAQKRRWGRLAYLANAVREASTIENVPHELELDGERTRTEAAQVFVANFGRTLPGLHPRRHVRADDGLLDVILVRAGGPLPALLAGWEALSQRHLGESQAGHAFRAQARKVRIETRPKRLVETDGSVIGKTPVTVSILPGALTVIVPAR